MFAQSIYLWNLYSATTR